MILCCQSPITLCDIYRRLKSKGLNTAIFKGRSFVSLEGIQLVEKRKKDILKGLQLSSPVSGETVVKKQPVDPVIDVSFTRRVLQLILTSFPHTPTTKHILDLFPMTVAITF